MIKRLLAILMISAAVFVGCGGENSGENNAATRTTAADDAYQQVREKRKVMDSPEEKLAITKQFLEEYWESGQTASAISAVFYYQGTEMGDMAGAVDYAETIRGKITDLEIAQEVDRKLIGIYGESGMAAKMTALADRLGAAGVLDFDDHWNVIEGAVEAEDWELVRNYCAKTRDMASAEAFRREYPDREFTEQEITQAVNDRVGMLMVKDGWAMANLGKTDETLAAFAEADKLIPRYYYEIPEYDLNVYWGNTLVMSGDFEAAIERFATSALIMRNEKALTGLKEAYVGLHGSDSGFEAYRDELHVSVSRSIDEFEMVDYDGNRHRFSDLRGDVTLVTLWFPT